MPSPAGGGSTTSPDLLATVADLTALIGTVDEDRALLLLECATAAVQAAVGQRILEVVDDLVTLDLDELDGSAYVLLPERPVTAVGAVLVGATAVTDFTAQLSRGRLWRPSGWRSGTLTYTSQPSMVTVTYTHGWPEGHQRLQLARGAVLSLAAAVYTNPTGLKAERIDDYSATYSAMSGQVSVHPTLVAELRRQYGRPSRSVQLVR